jgi:hypothetical protein
MPMSKLKILAAVSGICVGVVVGRMAHDDASHERFVRECAENRPLRECNLDACELWPQASLCEGTD